MLLTFLIFTIENQKFDTNLIINNVILFYTVMSTNFMPTLIKHNK